MSAQKHIHIIKNQFIVGIKAFGFYVLALFCFANLLFSQLVPDMYLQLIKEERSGLVEFMKKAKTLSQFKQLKPEIQETYSVYEKEVHADETKREKNIQKLEELLETNPDSRDILYSLYLLYEKDGNSQKAQEYLKKAKIIDPNVGNSL